MNILLFDTPQARLALKPFSDIRPLAHIRLGITTIEEKWAHYLPGDYSFITVPYLSKKFPCIEAPVNWCINSTVCPDKALVESIKQLQIHEQLVQGDTLIAFVGDQATLQGVYCDGLGQLGLKRVTFQGSIMQVKNKWDIFLLNEAALSKDFQCIRASKTTQPIKDRHTTIYQAADIFIEEGATIKAAILNAELGSIYIGKNAIVQEGAIIRGPVALGEGAQVNAGARIYNATTIGPYAKVGGEISNAVIFGYSNKVHDGFLGNAVIGTWCNLGAGTTTSNLKNDYSEVKVWDDFQEDFVGTNLQFCGLFMGDYSKCGINTMFNTGTVVGVSAHLFGSGFYNKFIPAFTRGGPDTNMTIYKLGKALEAAARTMERRAKQLTEVDKYILTHISQESTTTWVKSMLR
ncbi:MAG: putative sugar nucleotidyl transferase [Bacteroidota bacterium]